MLWVCAYVCAMLVLMQGSVLVREKQLQQVKVREDGTPVMREKQAIVVHHTDIIRDTPFWTDRPGLLE